MRNIPSSIGSAVFLLLSAFFSPYAAADDAATRQEREAKLIAVLRSDAPPQEKAIACKQLAVYGSEAAVPALAALLPDPQLTSWARIALEVIPGPAADEAFRDSLNKLHGRMLVGAINSIAARHDTQAIGALVARLADADAGVASAAAVALGRLGGPAASKAVQHALGSSPAPVRNAAAEACILLAEKAQAAGDRAEAVRLYEMVRAADVPKQRVREATRGTILARGAEGVPLLIELLRSTDKDNLSLGLQTAREVGGPEVTEALVRQLEATQPVAEEAPKVLVLKKATYGAGDRQADVTGKLAAMIRNNTLAVQATNGLAGDVAPGVVKQLRVVYTLGGEEQVAVAAENDTIQLGGALPPGNPRQVWLIEALGDVGRKEAVPALLKAASGGPWQSRMAAVRMLGRIGDARAVPVLLDAAQSGGEISQAALDSLTKLEGPEIDAAIVSRLSEAKGSARAAMLQLAGARVIPSATATLLADVKSDNEEVRLAAITALGMTAGPEQLGVLLDRLLSAKSPQEADVAKTALETAATRMVDRNATAAMRLASVPGAKPEGQSAILDVLGAVGGEKALAGVAAAAGSSDASLQDAASRVLGEWMTVDAAPVLRDLAVSGSEKHKIRALRGYLRIARQLDIPIDQRMALCREAAALCQRAEEKKLLLEIVRRYPTAQGLSLAAGYAADPALRSDAGIAAVAIAEKILPADSAAVAAAMKAVLDAGASAEVTSRAKELLDNAQRGAKRR